MQKEKLKDLKETNEGREIKMNKMFKSKRGITLIALVVTIVILLILAGVSISLVLDNNGIINRSKKAKIEYGQAKDNEQAQLNEISDWIDEKTGANNQGKFTQNATVLTANPAIEEGKSIKITNDIIYENYADETVQGAVRKFDEGEISSTRNLLTELNVDYNQEKRTNKNNSIDLTRFRPLTSFRDIYITDGNSREYTLEGLIKLQYKEILMKNLEIEMSDIIVLGIDIYNGKEYYYELESYDNNTGEISFEIETYGPIIILFKTEDEFTQTVNVINGSENIEEGKQLEITNDISYDNYLNMTVLELTQMFDWGEIASIQELCHNLGFSAQNAQTNKNNNIELSKLRAITLFRDIYITDGENIEYINGTNITLSYNEKFMKKLGVGEEIIILGINQEDGSIQFYEVENYNSTTGDITFEIENLGPILILAKE